MMRWEQPSIFWLNVYHLYSERNFDIFWYLCLEMYLILDKDSKVFNNISLHASTAWHKRLLEHTALLCRPHPTTLPASILSSYTTFALMYALLEIIIMYKEKRVNDFYNLQFKWNCTEICLKITEYPPSE